MTGEVVPERARIAMIGTSRRARGGIATVAESLASSRLFSVYSLDYIETHVDGTALNKMRVATKAWLGLLARLFTGRVDLLHVHVSSRASFWRKCLLLFPARMMGRPIVLHLHSGEFKAFYECESSFISRAVIGSVFEGVAGVVVLSDGWKQWVEQTFPRAKVRAIYNPAPTCAPSLSDRDPRTILFLGRLSEKKGVGDLLKAVAKISGSVGQVRVLLGGDGDILALTRLAEELAIEPFVDFLGWVDGARKSELLQQCSILALPSYNEGLPMGLLEAMGHGMPVVTTPVGGIPEAVTDGVEGFLVEPGDVDALADRLARLLGDPELCKAMGSAGVRKVAQAFAMDRIVPQWVALYSELVVMSGQDVSKKGS